MFALKKLLMENVLLHVYTVNCSQKGIKLSIILLSNYY